MSDRAKQFDSSDEPILSVKDWKLEATTSFVHSVDGEAEAVRLDHMKQMRDLAFAVAICDSGRLAESEIVRATRDWTAFGTTRLADHVTSRSLIRVAETAALQGRADALLERAIKKANAQTRGDENDPQLKLITALNPDGRIAAILGLLGGSNLPAGEIEDRSIGARYRLLRKLGQGGLGTVWLARDENLNRYVAVKELNGDAHSNEIALEHFRREAEITGRLEHPGIVPIYQFGRDEISGKAFYAMRFLGRRTLQNAIDEFHERRESGAAEKMLLHRLLSSFVSVCHSIGHAHAQKVVHRDLKPANVALDEFGQVTLLDWGLSKVNEETGMYDVAGRSEPGDLHDLASAQAGRVIGTPLYMAPEQAAGRLEEVDTLTDIYGLGGILYCILTGVGPHHSANDSNDATKTREQFLSAIVEGSPVAPQERCHSVAPELNAICMKALARQRYRRYQSAAELADDVERYIAGAPVHAYEAPLKRKFSRWMTRHPTLAQMLLLSASLIAIAIVAVAITARTGRERLVASRFASAVETAHDMEVNLKFEAGALERDLHFITELPLMSAITQSQTAQTAAHTTVNGSNEFHQASTPVKDTRPIPADSPSSDQPPFDVTFQTPEQWLNRQGELFDGFLDANPSYLMMASCKREDENQLRELVRSERVSAGQRAHRVPDRQLKVTVSEMQPRDTEFLEQLRPGSVLLTTNDQFESDIPTNNRSPLVVSGVSAVYDPQGDIFGINIIELDLRERLRSLIPAIAPEHVDVFVTDHAGQIIMDYRGGRFIVVTGTRTVVSEFPELSILFDQAADIRECGDGRRFYAKLVELGHDASRAKVGIVTHSLNEFQ